jgi:radical SAM protein with 4Fe4S-binding SPASM domain
MELMVNKEGIMSYNHQLKELTFEITRRCPMRCLTCSSEGGEPYFNEFSVERIKKIINEACNLGVECINISGGEPLIHLDIIKICQYIKNQGLILNVYTCGNCEDERGSIVPINKKLLDELKKTGIDSLIFSIQGPTEILHDQITAKVGSFNNLISSVRRAIEIGLLTEMHFVPIKPNYQFLPSVMELVDKINIGRLSVLRFVPQGRGRINKGMLELEKNDVIELKEILSNLRKNYPSSRFRIGSPFNCFQLYSSSFCNAGLNKATIKPDGRVFPCVSMKDFSTENEDNDLWKNTLSNIWSNSALFNLSRASIWTIRENKCNNCSDFKTCRGGCLTQKLLNKVGEKDPYCTKFLLLKQEKQPQLVNCY